MASIEDSTQDASSRLRSVRSAGLHIGNDARLAVGLVCLLRVGFGLTAIAALASAPNLVAKGNWPELVIAGGEPWSWLLSAWQRWDALWYQKIALEGYSAGTGTGAFFPLYPFLSGALSTLLLGETVLAELLISTLAGAVAIVLLYRLTRLEMVHGAAAGTLDDAATTSRAFAKVGAAGLTVLLTVAFPTAFFLLAPYTESLFLALTVGAFWLARANRPWAAGAVGFLAGLTRGQGALLVLPLAWEQLRRHRAEGEGSVSISIFAALLPALGFLTFSLYLRMVVGEQRSGLDALEIWGYRQVPPWEAVGASLAYISQGWAALSSPSAGPAPANTAPIGPAMAGIEALNLLALVAFSVLAALAARLLPLSYALYAWSSLALLWTRSMWYSPLMSTSRYCLVIFPCFMVAGALLTRRPRLALGCLAISVLLQLVLFEIWVLWGFVA